MRRIQETIVQMRVNSVAGKIFLALPHVAVRCRRRVHPIRHVEARQSPRVVVEHPDRLRQRGQQDVATHQRRGPGSECKQTLKTSRQVECVEGF
jgi:hypothetical protein